MAARDQPVRAPTGLPYGQRKQLEDAQRAVPLPDNTTPQGGGQQGVANVQPPNVFAPTERPGEPLTAGAAGGAGPGPLLPDMSGTEMLRALIMNGFDQSGDLRRLLERTSQQASQPPASPAAPQPPTQEPTAGPLGVPPSEEMNVA